MALSGDEIRSRLSAFAAKWSVYSGSERGGAQTYLDELQIGLTKLYNQVDDGAWVDLRDLHRELDEAVAAAYGWPRSIAQDADETNRPLLELNRAITAGEVEYDPFGTSA